MIVLNPTFFKFFNYEAEFEEGIYESNLVANDFFFQIEVMVNNPNCIGPYSLVISFNASILFYFMCRAFSVIICVSRPQIVSVVTICAQNNAHD